MAKDQEETKKEKKMKTNLAYSTYSQNNASIESPEKLIEMLYEGVLKFATQAKNSIEAKNIEKKAYWINRTSAIFVELISTLDYSAGDVSHYLNGLYNQEITLLMQANMNNDAKPLDEVIHVTKELLEAWRESV